ncbi:MAG: Rrf2 family transcriptional regulator [Deltaproteobacteria bacterium]|nr:Rrf2 family transcriptional regulator [Deltaproteobacteria bacterium]
MKLSTRGRYASRAMLDMALNMDKGAVSLKEMAKRQDISTKYLEQIFIPLKAAGLVRSVRGPRGGYTLARKPSEISLGEIIRSLEGSIAPVECVDNPDICKRSPDCVTIEIWRAINDTVTNILNNIHLDELVLRHHNKLKPLVDLPGTKGETKDSCYTALRPSSRKKVTKI